MRRDVVLWMLSVVIFAPLGISSGSWASGSPTSHLFEKKCSICHSIERPKSNRKTREGWQITVMRMKNDHDGPFSDEEARMIIEYLGEHYGE